MNALTGDGLADRNSVVAEATETVISVRGADRFFGAGVDRNVVEPLSSDRAAAFAVEARKRSIRSRTRAASSGDRRSGTGWGH